MSNKKAFNELTKSGQASRLKKYEKERAERGTTQVLGRLVRPLAPSIKPVKDGAKSAFMRLAVYNTETSKTDFMTVSAYIAADKVGGQLEDFYKSLNKGDLVSVEYKETNGFNNAYSVILRKPAKVKEEPKA